MDNSRRQALFDRLLEKDWNEPQEYTSVQAPEMKQKVWKRIKWKISWQRKIFIPAAAAIAVIAISSIMMLNHLPDNRAEYVVASDSGEKYILADSSSVYIEKGSAIKFSENFLEDRNVWIDGSATFEVKKHEGSQFRVHFGEAVIEVTGTCFHVDRRDAENDIVILYNGSIDFCPKKGENKIEMGPSQMLTYDRANGKITMDTVPESINWNDGKYCFRKVPVTELLDFVGKLHKKDIIIQNNEKSGERLSGQIRYDESIDDILAKICFSLDMKYSSDDMTYTLYAQ